MKIFILLMFVLLLSKANSQNLQFSQALLFNGTAVQTVPAGKVWKVEHQSQSYATSAAGVYSSLIINGVNWYHNNTSGSLPSGPVWLPSGTTVAGWGPNTNYNIIEFNIVP